MRTHAEWAGAKRPFAIGSHRRFGARQAVQPPLLVGPDHDFDSSHTFGLPSPAAAKVLTWTVRASTLRIGWQKADARRANGNR